MKKQDNSKHKLLDIKTELLVPYAKNARTHSPGQIEQVANSIIRFGFTNPILVQPDNTVVAGHCRLEAAKKIGLKSVPCIVLNDLTAEQCRALVIADNKLALNAGWDLELLASELGELKGDFALESMGFSDAEYAEILSGLPNVESSQNKKGGGDDTVKSDDYNTNFSLPSGDKSPFQQITFTFATPQAQLVQNALSAVANNEIETFGNKNRDGNALYEVVRQWAELKKLS